MDFKPTYEYRTTFANVPRDFPNHQRIAEDLSKISPKPPKGGDWQLAGSTSGQTEEGLVVFYFWERPARQRD